MTDCSDVALRVLKDTFGESKQALRVIGIYTVPGKLELNKLSLKLEVNRLWNIDFNFKVGNIHGSLKIYVRLLVVILMI